MAEKIYFSHWLHMHQPLVWKKDKLISNIQQMLESNDDRDRWDAKLMLRAYKNPATYTRKLHHHGIKSKIMLDFSGTLLQELKNLGDSGFFDDLEVHGEKIGNILELYKEVMKECPNSIEMVATGYYHPYFPVTPKKDWVLQIQEWKEIYKEIFGEDELKKVKGFWFPEMGIPSKEEDLYDLIKSVKECGLEWIILPFVAVDKSPEFKNKSYEEKCNIPFILKIRDLEIPAIVRDDDLGIKQQTGITGKGVIEHLYHRLYNLQKKGVSQDPISVPTSDGENGNVMMNEFFNVNFLQFYENVSKEKNILPCNVSEYLTKNKPNSIVTKVHGGSWTYENDHWGALQKEIDELSKEFHKIKPQHNEKYKKLMHAVLNAETSCYVYWHNEYWLNEGKKSISKAKKMLSEYIHNN